MNTTQLLTADTYLSLITSLISFTFCVLSICILIYYIRRRYMLHVEMKGISKEKLRYPNYRNHLKNLKIKAMISNFIIIILLDEFLNNSAHTYLEIQFIRYHNPVTESVMFNIRHITQWCYFPLLCCLLKVLWLAYLHSPYQYTVMRWIAYMVLRLVPYYLLTDTLEYNIFNFNGIEYLLYVPLIVVLIQIYGILDLITYVMYSRRFYQHLKAREVEAKFFKTKNKYLENKLIRIHFKVATILVVIALSSYIMLDLMTIPWMGMDYISRIFSIQSLENQSEMIYEIFDLLPTDVVQIMYRLLLNMNYLYVLFVIIYKYIKKRNLTRINDKIKPLVREYQDGIFNRQLHH